MDEKQEFGVARGCHINAQPKVRISKLCFRGTRKLVAELPYCVAATSAPAAALVPVAVGSCVEAGAVNLARRGSGGGNVRRFHGVVIPWDRGLTSPA
jgi:hypothetical protein